jgi:hypothetical protein
VAADPPAAPWRRRGKARLWWAAVAAHTCDFCELLWRRLSGRCHIKRVGIVELGRVIVDLVGLI